jgi:hypothetical protein
MFDPIASFVSAVNLHRDCPPTLLKALADSHPDREVWLQRYFEEKWGIESMDMFRKITLREYRSLREKGVPCTIPTMCVLTIKKDENLHPLCVKSCIIALGNHEDRLWRKSNHFAPVLRGKGNMIAFSGSFSSLTSINAKKTGGPTFPTCL